MPAEHSAPITWLGSSLGVERARGTEEGEWTATVKTAFFSEIERAVLSTGQRRPPIDPTPICRLRKIRDIRRSDVRQHGTLVPTTDGFVLTIGGETSGTHERFVLAHEVGHTFFYDMSRSPPEPGYGRRPEDHWVEEGLCSEGARRLLMPERQLTDWISGVTSPDAQAVYGGTRLFDVSSELLIRRLQETSRWKWGVAFVFIDVTTSGENDSFRLGQVFKTNNAARLRFARKGTAVDDKRTVTVLSEALRGGSRIRSWSDRPLTLGAFSRTVPGLSILRLSVDEGPLLVVLPVEPAGRSPERTSQRALET
jgi:hypothetical protein